MNGIRPSPASMASRGTILVADEERHSVQLIQQYLGHQGFRIETASDGREALAKVARLRPTLMILDPLLPAMDGWEVCRRVRQQTTMPIIMLTACAGSGDSVLALNLGADDCVSKPFNLDFPDTREVRLAFL